MTCSIADLMKINDQITMNFVSKLGDVGQSHYIAFLPGFVFVSVLFYLVMNMNTPHSTSSIQKIHFQKGFLKSTGKGELKQRKS